MIPEARVRLEPVVPPADAADAHGFFEGKLDTFKDSPRIIWVFPIIGVPQNGWFIMENPIKMDDLGVPLFSETSIDIISPV